MHLRGLSLVNFRNYRLLSLACDERANLFVGANGQGKTNLLEAIYYLCVARSCRDTLDKDLVTVGGEFFLIKGSGVSSSGRDVELEVRYAPATGKKVSINQQPQRSLADLFGSMTAVMISPDDRSMIQGAPSFRRRFLDIAIAQTSPTYLATLQDYRRVVRQRNEALRHAVPHPQRIQDFDVWNTQLIQLGSKIMRKRATVIAHLDAEVQALHRQISGAAEELVIRYTPSFPYEDETRLEEGFAQALAHSAGEEQARGLTVVGPHRDDLVLSISGLSLSTYGSQGQHKTAATALKLAEARFLWHQAKTPPLLLLDDVFAELDATRTAELIELLPTFGQVFLTAAKESDIGPYGPRFHRFRVHAGTVTSEEGFGVRASGFGTG